MIKIQPTDTTGDIEADLARKADDDGDAAIKAAIDGGDPRAAILLCSQQYGAALGRLCMSILGSQHDAEDVAQETLIDAYAAISSWRREGTMVAWLMTIARRKCVRLLEKRTRGTIKLRLVHSTEKAPAAETPPEAQLIYRERADRARAALSALKPSEREALLLRYGAELSFREIGVAWEIDEATARKRVNRALIRLRGAVAQDGRGQ